MHKPVHKVLLECRQVVGDVLALAQSQGVVAVGEDDGVQLLLIVQQVALVDMRDGNSALMLQPRFTVHVCIHG